MSNLRVLISTKIFPNAAHPGWAPFNRQQFAALSRLSGVEVVDVLATLPWFPGADLPLLRGRSLAQGLGAVPDHEVIDGLPVRHPRTLYVPKIDGGLSGALHLASLAPVARRYRGRVDVLLAAWAYPDGCAAVALGRLLGVPVVVKLHGSDINVLGQRRGPRTVMRARSSLAASRASCRVRWRLRALRRSGPASCTRRNQSSALPAWSPRASRRAAASTKVSTWALRVAMPGGPPLLQFQVPSGVRQ